VSNISLYKFIRQFKGIGLSVSKKLCLILGYDSRTKASGLKKKDLERIDLLVRERILVNKALDFFIKKNFEFLIKHIFIYLSLFFAEKYLIEFITKKTIEVLFFFLNKIHNFYSFSISYFFFFTIFYFFLCLSALNLLFLFFS